MSLDLTQAFDRLEWPLVRTALIDTAVPRDLF